MNKKTILVALIIFLICLFLGLMCGIIIIMNNNDNKTTNGTNINTNTNTNANISVNNDIFSSNKTENSIDFNDTLFSSIEKDSIDSNLKDMDEIMKNIKISIANVTTETQDYIKNKDDFLYKIKKFMYENNLLDADTMTLTNSNIQNNQLIMLFVMNNQRKTKLKIVYNITDNNTEVSKQ